MMNRLLFILTLLFSLYSFSQPRLIKMTPSALNQVENGTDKDREELIQAANKILLNKNYPTVVNPNKPNFVNKHDFTSVGPYWWPNPDTKDGLPYIRRDGFKNPDREKLNNTSALKQIANDIKTLGEAFHHTKDDKYVRHAVKLIRVFFLDKNTRMNPNMKHAQFIPGVNEGRITGIIDAIHFIDLIDGIQLMKDSRSFPKKAYRSVQKWFSEFVNWMEKGSIFEKSVELESNIGTVFQMQRLAYHSFLNEPAKMRGIYENDIKRLLKVQFKEDGSQPLELRRAKPGNYSTINLLYWTDVVEILENQNMTLTEEEKDILNRGMEFIDKKKFVKKKSYNVRLQKLRKP